MYQSEIQNIAHLKILLTKIGRNLILSIVFLKIELTYFGENDRPCLNKFFVKCPFFQLYLTTF